NESDIIVKHTERSFLTGREVLSIYIPVKGEGENIKCVLAIDIRIPEIISSTVRIADDSMVVFAVNDSIFRPVPMRLFEDEVAKLKQEFSDSENKRVFSIDLSTGVYRIFSSQFEYGNTIFKLFFMKAEAGLKLPPLFNLFFYINIIFFILLIVSLFILKIVRYRIEVYDSNILKFENLFKKFDHVETTNKKLIENLNMSGADNISSALVQQEEFESLFDSLLKKFQVLNLALRREMFRDGRSSVHDYSGDDIRGEESDPGLYSREQGLDPEKIDKLKSRIFSGEVDSLISRISSPREQDTPVDNIEDRNEFVFVLNKLIRKINNHDIGQDEIAESIEN
ncbi:MAG: hypothetical protein KAS39_05805, partial [Actinomycetia bacterium]|nr:hypothetical protein [Actinomycetes bacterium]